MQPYFTFLITGCFFCHFTDECECAQTTPGYRPNAELETEHEKFSTDGVAHGKAYFKMSKHVFSIRNYRPGDFENYAGLHREAGESDQSGQFVSKQRLAEDLGHPSFHPENNLFFAEQNGRLCGYVSVFLEPGIGRALLDFLVHPLDRRKGIATELMGHGIQHAKAEGIKRIQICIPEKNIVCKKMATRMGLRFVRHFIGYKLDLTSLRLPDVIVNEYIIRSLRSGEESALTTIQNRSFRGVWGFNPNTREEISYRINLTSCSAEDVIMIYAGNKPVAYCWTRIDHEANAKRRENTGEIHMLGVDPDYRRRLLGRNVLLAGLSHLKNKGMDIVELMADGEEPAGAALYESVGFRRYLRTEWHEKKLT